MRRAVLAASMLVAAVVPASAHAPIIGDAGVVAGLLHPLSVPAHLMVLVGLGLLAGQQASGRNTLLVMFGLGLGAGLLAIALAAGPSSAGLAIAVAAIVAGAWVATARPMSPLVAWPLMSVAGAAIGLDSPPDVVDLNLANVMLIGTWFGGVLALTTLAEAVAGLSRDWQRLGVRIVGSWVAAAAMLVLALALAR